MNLEDAFGIHAQSLVLRARRAEVLSKNLANAETPNYQARDFDFQQTLEQVTASSSTLLRTDARHLGGGDPHLMGAVLQYRMPSQPSIDGNTVDTQLEQSEFMKNAMHYEASLRFLSGRISGLLTAIRGE